MPGYYVYAIGHDGHVKDCLSIICEDDESAKDRAKRLVDGHAVELWQGDRKVAAFEPERSEATQGVGT